MLEQLPKNPRIEIRSLDPRKKTVCLEEATIKRIDFQEQLTPLTLEMVLADAKPAVVRLAAASEELGVREAEGTDTLGKTLRDEMVALAGTPMIEVPHITDGARNQSPRRSAVTAAPEVYHLGATACTPPESKRA